MLRLSFNMFKIVILVTVIGSLVGCASLLGTDVINSHVLTLEKRIKQLETTIQTSNVDLKGDLKRLGQVIAKMNTNIGSIEGQLQKQSGDIDLLHRVVGKDDAVTYLQDNNEGLLKETQYLQQDIFSLKKGLEELSLQLTEKLKEDLKIHLEELSAKIADVEKKVDEIDLKIEELEKNNKTAAKASSAKKPLASLKEARLAYQKKFYTKLSREIPGLIPKMTKKTSVEELSFYYANSILSLGNLEKGALELKKFIDTNPRAEWRRKATLRLADAFRYRGEKDIATLYYDEVIEKFPNSEEAQTASQRRAKMVSP
ncbi:MAG: hypothetical protein OXC44_02600 [Proteobacteria bacterium]|nr:hypothetical protein [Pseudomonadota bacterium]